MFERDPFTREPPRRREPITLDYDNPAAYTTDEYGNTIVRDGVRLRCRMTDAKPPPPQAAVASVPMVIGCKSYRDSPLKKFYYRDGTPKIPREARAAKRAAVSQKDAATTLRDAMVAAAMNDAYVSHKPGYRFADVTDGDTVDARVTSYNAYVTALQDAWKTPERRAQDLRDAQRVDPQMPEGFVEAFPGQWQRHLSTMELVSNQRPPGTQWVADSYTPAEGTQAPKGLLPFGAWEPSPQRAEGTSCSTGEGEAGIWTREGDCVYCRPKQQTAVTVEPTNRSTDAQPGTRAYVDAVWREMCDQLTNAWKG